MRPSFLFLFPCVLLLFFALPAGAGDPLAPADPLAPGAPAQVSLAPAEPPAWQSVGYEYLAGAATTAITVPPMMLLGQKLGTLSPNLIASALPPLLLFAIVPPVAATGSEWLVGRQREPGSRFHPAIWAAVGINALAMVIGSLSGVWVGDSLSLGLFTLAEALIMPAGITLVMHYTRRKRHPVSPAAAAGRPAFTQLLPQTDRPVPGPPTITVPLVGFSF